MSPEYAFAAARRCRLALQSRPEHETNWPLYGARTDVMATCQHVDGDAAHRWLLAMLAWLAAFLGASISVSAQDIILLSDSLAEYEVDTEQVLASDYDAAEFTDPPAVESPEVPQIGYDKGLYLRYSNTRSRPSN